MENKINIAEILSIDDLPNEIWKDIPGYKGFYQASNLGRIKRMAAGKIREHILKQFRVGEYMSVGPSVNNARTQRRVHRLVAMAFIPNPNRFPCINHKDENPSNNNVSNLEWCDSKYNNNYGTARDRRSRTRGKVVVQYDIEGNEISRYWSAREAARQIGKSQAAISRCCLGKYKSAYGYIWKYDKS